MNGKVKRVPAAGALVFLLLCAGLYAFFARSEPAPDESRSSPAAPAADHPAINSMDDIGDSPEALARALAKNPSHMPILIKMGQVAIEEGDPRGAVKHLREAVRIDPNNRDARLELGRALYASGQVEEAIAETEALLALDADNVDALYNLGAIRANQGDAAAAREYWNGAVKAGAATPSGVKAREGLAALEGGGTLSRSGPAGEAVSRTP